MTAMTGPPPSAARPGNPFARPNLGRATPAVGLSLLALYGGSLPNDTRSEWFRTLVRPDVPPRSSRTSGGFGFAAYVTLLLARLNPGV